MRLFLKIFIVAVLVLLFGAMPINIIAKLLEWFSTGLKWVATTIDFFGWGGII